MTHSSHKTRMSIDSSLYDEVCTVCGATDAPGDLRLTHKCPGLTSTGRRPSSPAPQNIPIRTPEVAYIKEAVVGNIKEPGIWVLFTQELELYDQPNHNLHAWWRSQPSLEQLCYAIFEQDLRNATNEQIVAIVEIWQQKIYNIGATRYVLHRLLSEGAVVK